MRDEAVYLATLLPGPLPYFGILKSFYSHTVSNQKFNLPGSISELLNPEPLNLEPLLQWISWRLKQRQGEVGSADAVNDDAQEN